MRFKKSLALIVVIMMMFSYTGAFVSAEPSISDISDHWGKDYISPLVENFIITGYEDGTFRPDNQITRAEFCVIIVNSLIYNETIDGYVNTTGTFDDVTELDWYSRFIETAYEHGLVSGKGARIFEPKANISRQEMAKIISLVYCKINELDFELEKEDGNLSGLGLIDLHTASSWANDFINVALKFELMKGNPDMTFSPLGLVTRAQAATVTYRILFGEIETMVEAEEIIFFDDFNTEDSFETALTINATYKEYGDKSLYNGHMLKKWNYWTKYDPNGDWTQGFWVVKEGSTQMIQAGRSANSWIVAKTPIPEDAEKYIIEFRQKAIDNDYLGYIIGSNIGGRGGVEWGYERQTPGTDITVMDAFFKGALGTGVATNMALINVWAVHKIEVNGKHISWRINNKIIAEKYVEYLNPGGYFGFKQQYDRGSMYDDVKISIIKKYSANQAPKIEPFKINAIDFPYHGSTKFVKDNEFLSIDLRYQSASTYKTFLESSGTFDVTLKTVGENKGQSTYKLYKNDVLLGEFKPPLSVDEVETGDKYNITFKGIKINTYDKIKVESTTGTIGGEDFSRGRWLAVFFERYGKFVEPERNNKIILQVDNPYMEVNSQQVEIDPENQVSPIMLDNRAFFPVEALIENLGGTMEWDSVTKTANITLNKSLINLTLGSNIMIVDEIEKFMDVSPILINGIVMLPVWYITDYFDCKVEWNDDKKQVVITY